MKKRCKQLCAKYQQECYLKWKKLQLIEFVRSSDGYMLTAEGVTKTLFSSPMQKFRALQFSKSVMHGAGNTFNSI